MASITTFVLSLTLAPALLQAAPQEALDLKSTGHYRASFDKTSSALTALLEKPAISSEEAARAAFLVALADNLATKIPAHRGAADLFAKIRELSAVAKNPMLRSRIEHALAVHAFRSGTPGEASAALDRLGYVRDYFVLGPLDNERGSGFKRRDPLELAPGQKIDLDAAFDGKKRPVHLRQVAIHDVPLATLDLGARLRPAQQVLAYIMFPVWTESPRDACLRLGSTGSTVVVVNGHEVLRRDCQRRPLGYDQDACSFALASGWNLVVVKLCTQEGDFQTRMRLTQLDGSPLQRQVRVGTKRADLDAACTRAAPPERKAAAPKLGAIAWLERRLANIDPNLKPDSDAARRVGMLAFRLAFLRALRADDDDAARRDRVWARKAVELMPSFGAAHYLLAYTLIGRGGAAADRDDNARYRAELDAVKAWPRCAEAMRAIATLERTSRNNLTKAEEWVDRALAVNPHFVLACKERLECLGARDFDVGREKTVQDWAEDPELGSHPLILREAIDVYEARGDAGRVLELQRKLVAADFNAIELTNLARLEMRQGDAKAALATAERALRVFPQNRRCHALLAGLHVAMNDLPAAERVWSGWLDICPEDERGWLALASLAAREGKTSLQVAHLSRALALNPNLKAERRQLEYLESGTKSFYAGFELSTKDALAHDPGPAPDAKERGDSHYYVFRHKLVRAYRDGTQSSYEHFLAKVLTDDGVNFFDTFRPSFFGGDQTARILEAKVIRPGGEEVRARLGRGFWVDLPPIRVGDYVEVAARVDDRHRSFFGDYFGLTHLFPPREGVPVHESRLDLILEPGRAYHFQTVGDVPLPQVEKLTDGAEHRSWVLTGLPRREVEPSAPSARETGPLLRVSTYGSWSEFAAWWWNLIRKQTVATPEIRAKVAALTKGATNLEDKVRRIYDFVVTDIRYKAWEFGVHGYKPYSVGAIFARRHGDCKDKAILMNTMLAEVGVQAFPVLIKAENRRERDDLTLPMVEHFNHCITFIPAQKGMAARFLDGTAEYHDAATVPSMDRGARVLTVERETGRVRQIPWTRSDDNRNEVAYHARVDANGNGVIEMTHRPHRNFAPAIRSRYGNEVGKRRANLADSLGKTFGKVEIIDMRFSDLKDLTTPVEYSVKFKVKGFAAKDGNGFRLRTAFRPERLSRLTPNERRRFDLLMTTPSSNDVTIVYEIPPGFEFSDIPKNVAVESGVGSIRFKAAKEGRTLTLHRVRSFDTQRVKVADYDAFKALTETVDRVESGQVGVRRTR